VNVEIKGWLRKGHGEPKNKTSIMKMNAQDKKDVAILFAVLISIFLTISMLVIFDHPGRAAQIVPAVTMHRGVLTCANHSEGWVLFVEDGEPILLKYDKNDLVIGKTYELVRTPTFMKYFTKWDFSFRQVT
jgi:hypothetical protein